MWLFLVKRSDYEMTPVLKNAVLKTSGESTLKYLHQICATHS
uniref:Uncharacterized protein n=1 Tax=Anguilla anguilla TaxID=7936 RepID=A0A0E9UAN4_ANGAN